MLKHRLEGVFLFVCFSITITPFSIKKFQVLLFHGDVLVSENVPFIQKLHSDVLNSTVKRQK